MIINLNHIFHFIHKDTRSWIMKRAVGEPTPIIQQGGVLEAKAIWEHSCIADGLLFFCQPLRKNLFKV